MPALRSYRGTPWRVIAPDPPRYDLWPEPVRLAWRLSGALVPCGPGVRGIGWPENPVVRLAALAPWFTAHQVATHRTAAWVWGAARSIGESIELSMLPGYRRPIGTPAELRIRELRGLPEDAIHLGQFLVTSPRRTILDLLYQPESFDRRDVITCRLLSQRVPGGLQHIADHIAEHRRPHRSRAQQRLRGLLP